MKRKILAVVAFALANPIFAQFSGDGYYRIKNKGEAHRYISIVNDRVDDTNKKVDVTSTSSFVDIQVYALSTVKNPITDPGSILYITGTKMGNDYQVSIQAQGVSTEKLTKDQKLQVINQNYLYAEYKGVSLYLSDTYESFLKDLDMNACIISGKRQRNDAKEYATWDIIKVDNTSEFIGVKPEITVGEKKYATLYTSFAYELSDGLKAYYIDKHKYENVAEPIAEMKEISKIVPASTPVIIECDSDDPLENKIIPLLTDAAPASIQGNELKGNYFCYVKMAGDKENEEPTLGAQLKNVVNYDADTMRVLGIANGKLALVPANDDQLVVTNKGKYLPANKAYITISQSESEVTAKGISVLSPEDYEIAATSIKSALYNQPNNKQGVYTLEGIKVSENTFDGLPKGIYISNNKKVVVK
mgnify:CR=1 FL=1